MIFKDKKILVLGAGISGISVANVLQQEGAIVCLSDSKKIENINNNLSCLIDIGVVLKLGNQSEDILNDIDYMVISPGVSINAPLVKKAQEKVLL